MRIPKSLYRGLNLAYFAGLLTLIPTVLGGLYLSASELAAPHADDATQKMRVWSLAAGSLGVMVVCGWPLAVRNSRRFLFGNLLFLMILGCTLGLCEIAARWLAPGWPELGLHGVPTAVAQESWGHVADSANGVGFNSWGERDHPRQRQPDPGTYRIAFIGDSFLEESPAIPLSVRVEESLTASRTNVEVLNLGVSATGPDEYFYRTKNIAIPLGCRHCVLFLYAGNDFVEPVQTLETYLGIAAVYPRGSLLNTVGLRGINHVLTNHRRPLLQAWFNSGNLLERENQLHQVIAQNDDEMVRQALVNAIDVSFEERMRLAGQLKDPGIPEFYQMLREPDAGRFRSYYLSAALWSVAHDNEPWEPQSVDDAFFWAEQTNRICREHGVRLTLVVVPEAFQVDPRMQRQWAPLADMKSVTKACRDAAERFVEQATDAGLEVIDLHGPLAEIPGTYLNLDGHWSQAGADLAASYLASRLESSLP